MSLAEETNRPASRSAGETVRQTAARGLAALDLPPSLVRRLQRLEQPRGAATGLDRSAPPPDRAFLADLRAAGLARLLPGLILASAAVQGLELGGWGLFGSAVLGGRPALWGLSGWLLLLASTALLGLGAEALVGEIAVRAGMVVKRRLARGALGIELDLLRRLGPSRLMTTALEATALEQNGLAAALGLVGGVVQLGFVAGLCGAGAAGMLHLAWLLLLLSAIGCTGVFYARTLEDWTDARLAAGAQLLEAVSGHRVWRTQWDAARRASHADASLVRYGQTAVASDRKAQLLLLTLPSLWTLGSLLTLVPAILGGRLVPQSIAVTIGAVLLGARAISIVVGSLAAGLRAHVAARQLAPFLNAAGRPMPALPGARFRATDEPVLTASGLRHVHEGRTHPTLDNLALSIGAGDRILVEGASGSGKSTLGAILTGLRRPAGGRILRRGRPGDLFAMAAPQFHENHLFSATLLENLYPAVPSAIPDALAKDAEELLDRLGLGELLARMPLGLQQRVGAGGWALSQGERSRVCLARALLADAELLVLDESLGALDPITAVHCLAVVREKARTLVLIAHP